MAKRRVWNALSNAYRTRLMRGGITQTTYEAGENLQKARGHQHTPEHPMDAIKNPNRYKLYRLNRANLARDVYERKERIFGNTYKWHEGRARKYVFMGSAKDQIRIPGLRIMNQFMKMTDEEIQRKASEAGYGLDDDWKFLFYH